jgi:hypothetical protein
LPHAVRDLAQLGLENALEVVSQRREHGLFRRQGNGQAHYLSHSR